MAHGLLVNSSKTINAISTKLVTKHFFVFFKGHALYQEKITKLQKNVDKMLGIFSRTTGPISTKLSTEHSYVKGN